MNALNRKDFLKIAGLVFASGAVLPAAIQKSIELVADPQIRFGRDLIRGTAQGAILSSSDEGSTWKQIANLGKSNTVLQLVEKDQEIYANLSLGSLDFWLKSADAQTWFTV